MLKTMTREHGHIEVDVQEILLKLRKQRSGMVQTEVRPRFPAWRTKRDK
jgi:hypothetical protein